jgi:hypothetical protein
MVEEETTMTIVELRSHAATYLQMLLQDSPAELATHADDLLLFLYRVRDAFPAVPVPGLAELLHALESDPDGVFTTEERRDILIDLIRRVSSILLRVP